ncbi:class I SAM-dependent methyltransferase [Winogradskyella haliclonae]|uniref:Methyltransferase n=1 Tax=Winogradskyella haliclonae TaxID=2048558 RepID=A0ABQ2BWN9_9FLAO|nr:class I SAM-dependent methyltransferase [Winogradskyella haliclonae]GGI56266.1 methyltransferase [Winogradskyella haliclonae]
MNMSKYITVKDHSVSGESFDLIPNEEQDILVTTPQPHADNLSKYYESEDYISHTDTKRNLLEHVYHLIRKRALKNKLSLINSFKTEEKTLLDIGCGTGDFLKTALEDDWKISGIEPNSDARNIANSKTGNKVFDSSKLSEFDANSFDVITLWHVLEHLPNLEEHLRIFNRLLKTNGHLIIAVPNYKCYDAEHYKSFWAAYDVPRHLWHFSQKGMKRIFEEKGLLLDKTYPMYFDSFYVSLLSEKYKSGFMNPFKAFWIGLRSNLKAKHSGEYSSLIYIFKKD